MERHEERHQANSFVEIMDITSWKDLVNTAVDKVIAEDSQSDDILEELKAFNINTHEENCLPQFPSCISYVFISFTPCFIKSSLRWTPCMYGLRKMRLLLLVLNWLQ